MHRPRPVLLLSSLFALHILAALAHPPASSPTLLHTALAALSASPAPAARAPPSRALSDERTLLSLVSRADALVARHHDHARAVRLYRLAALLGHHGAAASAAALLLAHHDTLPRDAAAAVRLLRFAAAHGQPDAHAHLGLLHASGLADRHGVPKSDARALLHWRVAAGAGNAYAAAALGFRYMRGVGVPSDCYAAAAYYKHAAHVVATDTRYWPTAHNFAHGDPPLASSLVTVGRTRFSEDMFSAVAPSSAEDLDLFYYYSHAAEAGDASAMTLIGSLLLTGGLGMDADPVAAHQHLRRAAAEGHGEAHGLMGHLAMKRGNYSAAMNHFRRSAATQDRIGHYALGMIFLDGLAGMQRDASKAAMHFTLAAERKHADASFQLAMLLWRGEGVERDMEKAYMHFHDAARLGNIQSKLNIATIVLEGVHPAKGSDCPRAVRLFKEVAEEGEWGKVFDEALSAFDRQDYYGSLFRHLQAAHAGIELGQYNAAMILEMAEKGDLPELQHWHRDRLLAEMHELYAMSGLQGTSAAYLRSADVAYVEEKDFGGAMGSYDKAAQLGDPEGMFSLATMYANGVGIAANREKALEYLELVGRKEGSPAVASNLATVGFQVWWSLQDAWAWLERMRGAASEGAVGEEAGAGPEQITPGASRGGAIKMGSETQIRRGMTIGDDVAIVGGLLLILITVLVLRGKRLSRQTLPGEASAS